MESENIVHLPVMVREVLEALKPSSPDGSGDFLIDCTLGEGGHSERFLRDYSQIRVLGLDRDASIQAKAKRRLSSFGDRVNFYLGWYNDFFCPYPLEERPTRILFDLGISVFHYVESQRGFSFRLDEPLDMRLNPDEGESACDVVNTYSEKALADLIFGYGEERYSRRIARGIVQRRSSQRVLTTKDLAEIIFTSVPVSYQHGRLHPATRTFQALRIHVNRELERIQQAVEQAFQILAPDGVLGIISFHSLEDRIVKNLFRDWTKACICPSHQPMCNCGGKPLGTMVQRKPLVPTEEEVRQNPPSRSAKFRTIHKLRDKRDEP